MILLVRYNPRFALNDLPQGIQDKVPSQTKREKIEAGLLSGPVFILYLAAIYFSTLAVKRQTGGNISFLLLFVHAYGVLFISSWLELLLADWLVYCTITPKFIIIPGTLVADGYKDYKHQFRAHLRGTAYAVPVALIISAVVSLVTVS